MVDAVPFPDRWLQPVAARMSPSNTSVAACPPGSSSWDIQVDLAPFDVSEALSECGDWPLDAATSFRFDFICLPIRVIGDLVDRTFEFPVNPEVGYVDGSMYLVNAHNPADLRRLALGQPAEGRIEASFLVTVDFEFEQSGFRNRQFQFTIPIALPDELLGAS